MPAGWSRLAHPPHQARLSAVRIVDPEQSAVLRDRFVMTSNYAAQAAHMAATLPTYIPVHGLNACRLLFY